MREMNVMYFIRVAAAAGRQEHFPQLAAFLLLLLPIEPAQGAKEWAYWYFNNNYKRAVCL